ncbi:hypothetical protein M5J20_09630 [Corynebacterium sp. TA-R-1]|uniref:Secreted protein n=1 Tax=Corynebacterium stercoris TaxID=2943490 RepID=A0ABT1G5V8_9CORY|nr:hypothetical protein [Corynebacterium stercoris]MCP1388438.1 hypothetical protein [Corynebacterium stercoris]
MRRPFRSPLALAVAAPLLLGPTLASCGAEPPTWQVVAVYTDPALPGDLPLDAAGKANVQVKQRGDTLDFTGTTPCATLTGQATVGGATGPAADAPDAATSLALTSITFDAPGDTCVGGARHTHDQLTELLQPGATFEVRSLSDTERLLITTPTAPATPAGTSADVLVDPPSIRLMRL